MIARVDAMVVVARTIVGALEVGMALDAFAPLKWTALVAGLASAGRSMVVAEAFGVHGTWVGQRTWIDALVVVARFLVRAFVVRHARQFEAAELRITRVARLADANRMMVLDVAVGVDTAIARTRTQFVDARFGQRALGVRFAANSHIGSWTKRRVEIIRNHSHVKE